MRVAVLACTRRVRCCEEEWQAVQRAHRGRAGRHWCAGPWCVEIGTPAGAAAGGAAWVATLPRGRVTRAAYDYAAAAGEGGRFVWPSRPRPGMRVRLRACEGRGFVRRPPGRAAAVGSTIYGGTTQRRTLRPWEGRPGHQEGRGAGAATWPPDPARAGRGDARSSARGARSGRLPEHHRRRGVRAAGAAGRTLAGHTRVNGDIRRRRV
jgi:hypothetical protein